MRPSRLTPLALIVLTAAAVAACAGSAPGWTYAPAPPITPPPSVEPSGEPSGAPSLTPSGQPSAPPDESAAPSGSAAPSAAPSGDAAALQIAALNIQFDQDTLSAPADQPFQITFANNDPGVPHNVEIKDGTGASLFMGEVFNGVETRTYDVPALAAGEYQFLCTVHPTMAGTLTAGG